MNKTAAQPAATKNNAARSALFFFMPLLPLIALVTLALLLYANALTNPYIIDDAMMLTAHPALKSPGGFMQAWAQGFWAGVAQDPNLYRPVTIISYWLNATVTGLSPVAVRLTNVLILALVAWSAGLWLKKWVDPILAWAAVTLWLTLPSNVESINHTVGRADLLALLGTLIFLNIQRAAHDQQNWSLPRVLLAALAAMLAMGAKETGLILLPCAIAQAWVLRRQTALNPPQRPTDKNHAPPQKLLIKGLGILLAVFVVYVTLRISAIGTLIGYQPDVMDLTGNPLRTLPWQERLSPSLAIVWWYFSQALWPTTTFNQIPAELPDSKSVSVLLGFISLVGVLGLAARGVMKNAWYVVPALLVLGTVLLVSNLFLPVGIYAASRLSPPITLGLWMLLCAALSPMISPYLNRGEKSLEKSRVMLGVFAALLVSVLAVRTLMANTDWASQQARMAADVREQPDNPVALYHLGTALTDEAEPALGAPYLEKAVALRPDSPQARMNLAVAKLLLRDYPAAAEQYQAVLNMNPPAVSTFRAQAATALGVIALYERDFPKAQQFLSYSLQLRPGHADTLYNLGESLKATGKFSDALKAYGQALQSQPGHTQATRAMNELQKAINKKERP